jgi:ribosome biogenesis GTPase
MEDSHVDELLDLGFGPFFERQLSSSLEQGANVGRVATEHRGAYEVWTAAGAGPAWLAGRLRLEHEAAALPAVGDWVVLADSPAAGRTAVIERVLERRTAFTRGAAGRGAREQVVAANVDLVLAVSGLDADFNPRRIERYLARIWASGARPAVVLNKADVCADLAARTAEVEVRAPGVPILVTSALLGEGLEDVRGLIPRGTTVALVGSSGAGKSTLVNALLGEQRMATGEVRASDGRGRHVTSHRQLARLPGGGLLLDTPGMRELALADADGLDALFADIGTLARACRFRNCRHESEPGCAVRAAVASGGLAADRLEHWRFLEREARAFERRHDERMRRRDGREWGQRYEEVARLRRWKGGKE